MGFLDKNDVQLESSDMHDVNIILCGLKPWHTE